MSFLKFPELSGLLETFSVGHSTASEQWRSDGLGFPTSSEIKKSALTLGAK